MEAASFVPFASMSFSPEANQEAAKKDETGVSAQKQSSEE